MTDQSEGSGHVGPAHLSRRDVLRGAAVAGAFLAVDLGALLYANNWIGPARLTPRVFLEGFAKVFGRQPGFRKNHAKRLCSRPVAHR
jgi:catalase